jgi:hypothetical protein
MIVFINNREMAIFRGATVIDAVRIYSLRSSRMLEHGFLQVFDRFGNHTEPDGELTQGQILFLKKNKGS